VREAITSTRSPETPAVSSEGMLNTSRTTVFFTPITEKFNLLIEWILLLMYW
jgi:hypothetical protein